MFEKNHAFTFIKRADGRYKSKGAFQDFNKQKEAFEEAALVNRINLNQSMLVVLEEERNGAGLYLISSQPEVLETVAGTLPEIRGCFLYKDISFLLGEIGKPLKTKIENALLRPLLLS